VFNPWLSLAYETAQLGFDAQRVIALRVMRLMAGGTAGRAEAQRMVREKAVAFGEAQVAVAGALGSGKSAAVYKVLGVYKKRVRANRRRLSRR
jgi:hypothetical protein